jgi:hypothetical protein
MMMVEVIKLKYLGGYRLRVTFSDSAAGEYDFSPPSSPRPARWSSRCAIPPISRGCF